MKPKVISMCLYMAHINKKYTCMELFKFWPNNNPRYNDQELLQRNEEVGGELLEAGQSGKQGNFGKEGMHEESDSWKEEQHTHMHGRPNNVMFRVLVMYCNGWRAKNRINIVT
jgi:hypothetical protein